MDGTIDPSLLTLPLLHSVFNGAATPQIPSSDPLIASVDASQDVDSPALPCLDFIASALFEMNATTQQDGLVLNSIEALCAPPSDAPMLDTPLSGRAKIPKEAKTILDAHFVQNPYPKPPEISALADQLLLKPSTVKNWFGNARVRKLKERKLPSPPPPQEILDNLPLKRYLSCTPDDEAVSSYAIEANIRAAELEQNERYAKRKRAVTPVSITMDVAVDYDFRKDTPTPQDLPTNQFAYSSYSRYTTPPLLLPLTPSPPRSRASSQSSASSAGSFHNLVAPPNAHRGSRRGQKRWVAERPEASSGGTVNFCCTFPGCGRDFAQKSDWVRHEESIHVPQRIWICCKTSVSEAHASIKSMRIKRDMYPFMVHQRIQGCENKPPSHRTFLRKDQFLAHVRKCHKPKDDMLKLGSAKWLNIVAAHWSEELTYPSDHSSRRCELCDLSFTSWDERTSHFVDHFKSGVLIWKTKHLAETEGTVFIPPRLPGIFHLPYRCPLCRRGYQGYKDAVECAHSCVAWSCRFHAGISSLFLQEGCFARCKLCQALLCDSEVEQPLETQKRVHYDMHKLLSCSLEVFKTPIEFSTHLCRQHNGQHDSLWDHAEDWACRIGIIRSLG